MGKGCGLGRMELAEMALVSVESDVGGCCVALLLNAELHALGYYVTVCDDLPGCYYDAASKTHHLTHRIQGIDCYDARRGPQKDFLRLKSFNAQGRRSQDHKPNKLK